jgi:alpha-tubulin suppressor-like RCC1 family protein
MYSWMALWAIVTLAACGFERAYVPDDGMVPDDTRPTIDARGCEALDVQASGDHTCAVTRDGKVYCWGRAEEGQLGVDPLSYRCVGGSVYCHRTPLLVEMPPMSAVGVGSLSTCAASSTQGYCWGKNSNGQFGNGQTFGDIEPLLVPVRANATAIRGGAAHLCSLVAGSVWCAGYNMEGQVGNMSVAQQANALVVMSNATAISLGASTSCAINNAKQLLCWGRNFYRTIDPANTAIKTFPTLVAGVSNIDSVAVGADHICIVSAGTLNCRGLNTSGQIGNGQTNNMNQPQPLTLVGGVTDVVEVSASGNHTCARQSNGDVYCFGEKYLATPTKVASGASRITSGQSHDCGLFDGVVQCWGDQLYGQLGNNVDDVNRATSPQVAKICP